MCINQSRCKRIAEPHILLLIYHCSEASNTIRKEFKVTIIPIFFSLTLTHTQVSMKLFYALSGKWKYYINGHDLISSMLLYLKKQKKKNIWVKSYGRVTYCIPINCTLDKSTGSDHWKSYVLAYWKTTMLS